MGLALLLCLPIPALAEAPVDTVRQTRLELSQVRDAVKAADPYPGGRRWVGRLDMLTSRVEELGVNRFRWLRKGLVGFAERNQASAVRVLNDLEQRLLAVEDSLTPTGEAPGPGRDEVKGLLRPRDDTGKPAKTPREAAKQPEKRPREKGDDKGEPDKRPKGEFAVRRGDGLIQPGGAGLSPLFWPILAGLLLAVVLLALVLWWRGREGPARPTAPAGEVSVQAPPPAPHEQAPAAFSARPRSWPALAVSRKPHARSITPSCRCCTASNCCAMKSPAPTANMSARCRCRPPRRRDCTSRSPDSRRSSTTCGTATGAVQRAIMPGAANWPKKFARGRCSAKRLHGCCKDKRAWPLSIPKPTTCSNGYLATALRSAAPATHSSIAT